MKTKKHFPIVGFQKEVAIMVFIFHCIYVYIIHIITILWFQYSHIVKEEKGIENEYRGKSFQAYKKTEKTEELILSFRLA